MACRALARRPQPAQAGLAWIAGDLADPRALATLCDGADAVIHGYAELLPVLEGLAPR